MHMVHKLATETRLVNGLVLDHGARYYVFLIFIEFALIFLF